MKFLRHLTALALLACATVTAAQNTGSSESMIPSEWNFVGASGVTYQASAGAQNVLIQDVPAATARGWLYTAAHSQNSGTFTIASGCGTPALLTGSLTGGTFKAGQTACAPVITLPTAQHGYFCFAWDLTTTADTLKQTADSAVSCTLSGTVVSADVILFFAFPF